MKTHPADTANRLSQLMSPRGHVHLPKGEIWIGSTFLERAGLTDTIDNHFRLADQLDQDLVCLSIAEQSGYNDSLGYRYFPPGELTSDHRPLTNFLAAVIDGPFQRLVNKFGLMKILLDWMKDNQSIQENYADEQKVTLELTQRCLDIGVDAIIFADDLSGEHGPLINPIEIDRLCTPFYTQAISFVKHTGSLALLHCCGNLSQLVSMLSAWNLDGLAAIQMDKNDMPLLGKELGGLIFAGLETPLLETERPDTGDIQALKDRIRDYARQKRLVLCSSCGLYSADFFNRIKRIYSELAM